MVREPCSKNVIAYLEATQLRIRSSKPFGFSPAKYSAVETGEGNRVVGRTCKMARDA